MNITTRSTHYVFPTKSASRSKFLVKKKKRKTKYIPCWFHKQSMTNRQLKIS